MSVFFSSQSGYCPLVWIFHSRTFNSGINKLLEGALRFVYKDSTSCFDEMLKKENTFTTHPRNIQKLLIEMYKVKHKIAQKLMCELFQ